MKLVDYRTDYYTFSGKASDVARQLAFAGIALIWIFKVEKGGPLALPEDVLFPAGAFVVALSLDLLHYVYAALVWGAFSTYQKSWKKKKDQDELPDAPSFLNWPALACFWLKLLAVLIGYWSLLQYMRQLLHWP